MATVKDVALFLDSIAPCSMKMDFDNVGLLAGDGNKQVHKVLLALDVTDEVIAEAVAYGADLLVTHHPLMFSIKNASTDDMIGRKLVAILGAGMSAVCMHTNLDAAVGGVNDCLMNVLGITAEGVIEPYGVNEDGIAYGMGRYGTVQEMPLVAFLQQCKNSLQCNGLRYVDAGKPVTRVAVCGGSGSSMLQDIAALGCDTFVTADVKHNGFLDAKELGINLIDAGHYSTENVVIPYLHQILAERFPALELKVSRKHGQPEQYFV